MLKDSTAAELAGMLDGMARHPHNTGGLSMLDEATLAFGDKDPKVRTAQSRFAQARHVHQRSYRSATDGYSDDAWQKAMAAAGELATELRRLGDMRIVRCKAPAGWGECNMPLPESGVCDGRFHVAAG